MKKIVSIAIALCLVFSLGLTAFAAEVVYSEDFPFWDAGNWTESDIADEDGNFFELLNNENAYLVITRSVETHIEFSETEWEKFNILDSWWSGVYPNPVDEACQWIQLGTAGHTSEDEASILVDCVYDDGITIKWPGKPIYDLLAAAGALGKGKPHIICNEGAGEGIYKITNVSIVIEDEPIVAEDTTTEAPAEDTTPAEDAPAAVEDTATSAPADTGIALALVPMAIAAAAVVVSKRR